MKINSENVPVTIDMVKQHLCDSSRNLMDLTASMTFEHPELLKLLIEVAWMDKDPWSQRASHVVNICSLKFPELIKPYVSEMIRKLVVMNSESVIRNYLNILAEIPFKFNKKDKSILLNSCFDYLSGEYTVSVKVYSMEILYKMSLETPEIGIELSYVIEEFLPISSAGVKKRGLKILEKLRRDKP